MAKTCFFISRIGDAGSPEREFSDKLLKYIVEPVLEKCGYESPIRADHITQPGVITTQVFTHLWDDDLVIADLTGNNPNVFYELAVRHIRRKPFVHLIQRGHRIPFDVSPNRTIEFDFEIESAELAKSSLEAMVSSAGEQELLTQTPLATAIDFTSAGPSSDPLRFGVEQILSIVQEIKGTLDRASFGSSPLGTSHDRRSYTLTCFSGTYTLTPHAGGSELRSDNREHLQDVLVLDYPPAQAVLFLESASKGRPVSLELSI